MIPATSNARQHSYSWFTWLLQWWPCFDKSPTATERVRPCAFKEQTSVNAMAVNTWTFLATRLRSYFCFIFSHPLHPPTFTLLPFSHYLIVYNRMSSTDSKKSSINNYKLSTNNHGSSTYNHTSSRNNGNCPPSQVVYKQAHIVYEQLQIVYKQ